MQRPEVCWALFFYPCRSTILISTIPIPSLRGEWPRMLPSLVASRIGWDNDQRVGVCWVIKMQRSGADVMA